MTAPALRFCFEAYVTVGAALEVSERRRVIPITGGTVHGPSLRGIVLPGGADWQTIREDGTAELEARYVIRAEDGSLISVLNRGLRHGPPEVMQRLKEGGIVRPGEYYFRATPQFFADSAPHQWMSKTVFVCSGERRPDSVVIRVWAVE